MWAYLARRLLLVIPTLLGIMVINFVIVQAAPGGPVDQTLAQIRGAGGGALERVTGSATRRCRRHPRRRAGSSPS